MPIYTTDKGDMEIWRRVLEHLKHIKGALTNISTDAIRMDIIDAIFMDLRDNVGTDCRFQTSGVTYPGKQGRRVLGEYTGVQHGSHSPACS